MAFYDSQLIKNMKKSGAKPPSKKGKFKRKLGDNNFGNKTELTFKNVSDEELASIKENIRLKHTKEKQKEKIVLFVIAFIVLSSLVFAILI